jgi:hypothetical protein
MQAASFALFSISLSRLVLFKQDGILAETLPERAREEEINISLGEDEKLESDSASQQLRAVMR